MVSLYIWAAGYLVLTYVGVVVLDPYFAEAIRHASCEYDYGILIAQIHADPALLELCSKELSSFNKRAAVILLEHSNIETIQDAELVVNFYLNEGASRIHWGLEGMDGGIHISRLPPSGLETSEK